MGLLRVAHPDDRDLCPQRIEPLPAEVQSYNFALSLHQRDVLRASPGRKQPDDWYATRPSKDGWYKESKKKKDGEPPKPSGEMTIGNLMRAANGGECWSLTMSNNVNKDSAPAGIQQALKQSEDPNEDLPTCASCNVQAPGLLTLPCLCDGEVCGECFISYQCDKFEEKQYKRHKCPLGCRRKQQPWLQWAPLQPRLILQTDEARQLAAERKNSRAALLQQQKEAREKKKKEAAEGGDGAAASGQPSGILRKQPSSRPLPPLPTPQPLASVSDKQLMKRAKDWGLGAGGKLVFLAQELRDLAKKGDAKVYVTPPSNTAVRKKCVETLKEVIGKDAVANLNVSKADHGKELAKWKGGYGRYWQCKCCGEEHGESALRCDTCTYGILLSSDDEDEQEAEPDEREVRRFMQDVRRVDDKGNELVGEAIFIGNRVAVLKPGTEDVIGYGTVHSEGKCNGKRPVGAGDFRDAPRDSCFVLVLNPQTMEGLDLAMATHAYQFEPILREDKEKQAQARGQRLGGARKLEIVQLLMAGTIEEKQYDDLAPETLHVRLEASLT